MTTTALIKYEAACRALAECKAVDEVKAWADKAAAMQAYGKMAQDRTLEVDASEIRIRAERRLGELLASQKAGGGLAKGAKGNPGGRGAPIVRSSATTAQSDPPTLADAGISKDLSSRAQKLAAVPAAEFEAELAAKRERDQKDGARVSARLEKKGEKALKAGAATGHGPEPDDDGPTVDEVLTDMEADLRRAEARVADLEKALEADGKATVVQLQRRLEHAERRQAELMDEARRAKGRADLYERLLSRCGKAVGDRNLDNVAAKVEAAMRELKTRQAKP